MPKTDTSDIQNLINRTWKLSHGVRVTAHNYDHTLCAFEILQYKRCLGTFIPNNIGDMERMVYLLDNDLSIEGFHCNDPFDTVIQIAR